MELSVAIMAHPKREHFVKQLRRRLPRATVVWDEKNDRWDTGRRALLAFDKEADWHLVVQDDAILCRKFLAGVRCALDAAPPRVPVSFYTGKTRPYGSQIKREVEKTRAQGRHWLALRGPLWGVAVALPVPVIEEMILECDRWSIPNYDLRMAEYFHQRKISCWYSLPSLVDHRVGPDNPSLVPERGAAPIRTAHMFLGEGDPTTIDWRGDAHFIGDPSEPWTEDYDCTRCAAQHDELLDVILHAIHAHGLGPIDFFASNPRHAKMLDELAKRIPVPGTFYFMDKGRNEGVVTGREVVRVRPRNVRAKLVNGPFTICGAMRDLKYMGNRAAWSLDGMAN